MVEDQIESFVRWLVNPADLFPGIDVDRGSQIWFEKPELRSAH